MKREDEGPVFSGAFAKCSAPDICPEMPESAGAECEQGSCQIHGQVIVEQR
jgi:hypothetical protein